MILDEATRTALSGSSAIMPRWLLHVEARNRSTGAVEPAGIWNEAYDRNFVIDGVARAYAGVSGLLMPSPLEFEAGTNIQMQRVSVALLEPRVEALLRVYDPRMAPAELHLALFDPDTEALVSVTRVFKGFVDAAPIREGEMSDGKATAVCELTLASSAREGTRTLAFKKSDLAHKRRDGDRGHRYSAISGSYPVWWGEDRD